MQPQVSSASVNLTTETAIVWPVSEAKAVPNWQKELGEALARHLTTCGFKSNLRGNKNSHHHFGLTFCCLNMVCVLLFTYYWIMH